MFHTILTIVLVVMSISLLVCFIRTVIGPTMPDRIVALDSLGINLIGFIGILMIVQETIAYSEVVLVISILAFIGTIALSKFIERGVVFDRD
ncbi:Na(+)/H(+) antiporter subunit F1 [Halalkalibacter akibai]|uniref:Na(+) H(+) antiporter subunit F n=1 Tax=Halalkalibacter akibai (strain ATCC 43226 / DSM 21942 / CIP 109018 / JCM 9157 / 1139) TaxID=1236973 RepID=W4QMH8_HALA3|nr:Na(+)/H(+) antiporter subunit F1 [Halalkalibacter akibai]GAE33325.1 Na(+) H(+) antiporter subunit F [Halalkalibacter akibai JCM 9157]